MSFSYYGLAMDLQNFGVSIYLIQVIFGAIDIPAKVVVTITMSYLGRRVSLASFLIVAGLIIIINIFVPTGETLRPCHGGLLPLLQERRGFLLEDVFEDELL